MRLLPQPANPARAAIRQSGMVLCHLGGTGRRMSRSVPRTKRMSIGGTEPRPSKYPGRNLVARSIETDLMISLRLPEAKLPPALTRSLLLPPITPVVRPREMHRSGKLVYGRVEVLPVDQHHVLTASQIIQTLRAHQPALEQQGIRYLSLFGSVAHGGADAEFEPATLSESRRGPGTGPAVRSR
jgi:hypothetical protein